jgi:hypothetical protein
MESMTGQSDIAEFAKKASEEFERSQQGIQPPYNLGLSRSTVEKLISAVFFASTIPDEGRFPSVSLMTYRKDSPQPTHFPFSLPIPASAEHIAKFSHAVSHSNHLRLVSDNGHLLLSGIQITVLDELRQFGYSSFRTANPLKLVIKGPGHVEFSTGGIAVIFKAGEIFQETLFQSAEVTHELAQCVAAELASKTKGKIESLEDLFNDLAQQIVQLGHGGLLLFTKEPDLNEFSSCRKVDSSFLQELLIRYWDDAAALVKASGGLAPWLGKGTQREKDPQLLKVASNTTMLENCVNSIAHLAGVDGAIVLDYSCRVIAFNAVISTKSATGNDATIVDDIGNTSSNQDVAASRGSRHQSAVAFAKRVKNSFAFVISQDGSVSAIHNRGDGTARYEQGLRPLS